MKTGLFFGSFNPVHIGHMAIANYMLEFTDMDELWMIVSPHNPFKTLKSLASEYDRIKMVELAIGENHKISASDIEFRLPKPSYTIDTLTYLGERNPSKEFVLIIGSDNLDSFHKWKNYEEILKSYQIYVYPRLGSGLGKYSDYKNIRLVNAPTIEVSSSFIRESIKLGKDIRYFLNSEVFQYIQQNSFYKS
ncbi:MAG: nicotinate (nicotinamide) nucleotide adenylyltransferase [Bacteroidales bacterium]